jgi:poly(3-hydroxyalkanoate) depolymerase
MLESLMLDEYLHWRGHRIHVQNHGNGKPLLLINGLGGSTDMWASIVDNLGHHRALTFDAPGAGRSSMPAYPVTIRALADLAGAVLDQNEIESADVLGYSYGGAVAQQFAFDYPGRVRRLVLAATSCGVGAQPGSPRAMNVLATPFRFYSRTYFERIAAPAYGGRTGRNAAVREKMMQTRRAYPPSTYGYSMQIVGGANWTSRHFLHAIPHETLVICGDDDPLMPVANARMLAERIPNARLEIIARAGHLFLWDDAETAGPIISRFLEEGRGTD